MGWTQNHRNLVVFGVAFPSVLALSDRWILDSLPNSSLSSLSTVALFGFFAAQIAVVSWLVPRFITPWPLRWILWIWIMFLIDLQLGVLSSQERSSSRIAIDGLAAAMLVGQLGAVVVWGILGSGELRWRIPSLIVLLFVLWNFYGVLRRITLQPEVAYFGWEELLFIETTMLSLLCAVIRLQGFTLSAMPGDISSASPLSTERQPMQFGIRHMLIGTTAFAVLLGLAKAGDLLTSQFVQKLTGESSLFIATVAVGTASVLLVALWAALGHGNLVLRISLAILLPLIIGGGVAWYCLTAGGPRPFLPTTPYWMIRWYATGYWWIGYMLLTAILLCSSLLIFRTLGYRLVRMPALSVAR